MCAIGRALMSRPKMILLDEPSMGLAPQIVEEIFEIVKDLNEKEGVSFLLAEQNTNMALRFARYGYILENGRVVMDGDAKSLAENEDVKEFYLGISEGRRKSLPRRQALPPAQALAGVRSDAPTTTTTPWKPAIRRRASASSSRALPEIVARAMTAPGWAKHLAGVDPKSVTSRAALAKLPVLRKSDIAALQKENPPFGGLNVTAAGQGAAAADVAGADLRAGRRGRRLVGRRARAVMPPASAPATSCTIRSPITSRPAASFSNRARTRSAARSSPAASAIPSSSSRRSRITSRPAMSARRIFSRSCSTPPRRPARTPPRSSAGWCRARRCRPRCARNWASAASRCCNAMPPPSSA